MQTNPGTFQPLKTLSVGLMVLLAIQGVIQAVQVLLSLGELYFPHKVQLDAGQSVSTWILGIGLTVVLQLPTYIATVVLFLMFVYRSYKNLGPLRAEVTDTTPGWAVGYWFIPFVNLVKPFLTMREIWRQSDPDIDPHLRTLSGAAGTPAVLGFWWALWLGSNLAANISTQIEWSQAKPDDAVFAGTFGIASLLAMLAAVLAVMVVKEISDRQTLRAARLEQHQYHSVPPEPPEFN